ncbi:MAG: flagellar biosynthesis anti-sigma factor FlgM [Deltaproteobacteria bacterium]|nr:flagellar biosynthesis anti-sigma factor FlgM [Deltaproteobacteria bacterium]
MASPICNITGTLPGSQVEPSTPARSASVRSQAVESNDNGVHAGGDLTALSGLADKIQAAISQAGSVSSFRPELVAQLKSAIANQSYTPQLDQVAARIAAAIGKR